MGNSRELINFYFLAGASPCRLFICRAHLADRDRRFPCTFSFLQISFLLFIEWSENIQILWEYSEPKNVL